MCGIGFTGIGRLVNEIINHLPEITSNWEFVIFLNKEKYKKYEAKTKNIKKVLADEKIYSVNEQISFLKKLKKEKCDLVYFLHFNVPLFYKGNFIVTIHDLTLFDFPGNKMNKWYQRFAFYLIFGHAIKKAKKIITVSKFTKDELIRRYPNAKNKIDVVYNGVDRSFFNHKKTKDEALKIVQKKFKITHPFFLYTGVWREHKNLAGLVKAFGILNKKGFKANLVLTGRANEKPVLDLIKKENLENEIIRPGLVSDEDLKSFFRAARCFVFPSFAEGFGIPPLEAMASGTPVCASNATSIPEVCGNAAVYFDPKNVNEIADKMEEVFKNEELQKELVKKGLKQAKKFTWEKAVKEIKIILENI